MEQSTSLHCDAVCGEGSERDQCHLLCSLPVFSHFPHFPHFPQSNWALLVLIPGWVGLCMFQDPVGLSNELSCEAGSFSCCCLNPTGVFNQRFEALCPPHWNSGLGGLSPSPPAAALPAMLHNPPPHWFCQPLPCQESSLPAAHLRPSYGSG